MPTGTRERKTILPFKANQPPAGCSSARSGIPTLAAYQCVIRAFPLYSRVYSTCSRPSFSSIHSFLPSSLFSCSSLNQLLATEPALLSLSHTHDRQCNIDQLACGMKAAKVTSPGSESIYSRLTCGRQLPCRVNLSCFAGTVGGV